MRKVDLSDIGYMSYYGKLSNMAKKGGRRSALVRFYVINHFYPILPSRAGNPPCARAWERGTPDAEDKEI